MNEAPSLLALDRIEDALARIEAAARPSVSATASGGDADLRRRHDDLKACVAQSLAGLDELLAQRDRG